VVQNAARAVRLAGFAHAATVKDKKVREEGSLSFGHNLQKVALYLFGIAVFRQAETARYSSDVGVHDNALVYIEGVAEYYVGGLASHAGEGYELGHGAGNLCPVFLDEDAGHALYGAGLVAEETYGPYLLFQEIQVRLRIVMCGRALLEEPLRDPVDPNIRGLSGEYRRHQKLKRVLPIELGLRIRIRLLEARYHLAYGGGGTFGVIGGSSHDGRGLYPGL
jgi:hypothetical protein